MTISQKRAVGYAIRRKVYEENKARVVALGLWDDFMQSGYRYLSNYVKYVVEKKGAADED